MFTLLADHKAKLNRLAELIRDEKKCAAQIYSEGTYVAEKKKILDVASQKTNEEFIVLFVGIFSCGKTSMINALIGEELLPTGFLPETAIFCELHYGKQKRITVYPRGGDEPFDLREVTTEEIRKYVSLSTEDAINTMEQNEEGVYSSKFDKMVIYWPLEILKDGVVLVDSPGIDDPYINDYIVNNDYLPKADAIVYVMNLQYSYQRMDKDNLNKINALGRKNIVTACTFYDTVEEQTRYNPDMLIRVRNRLINYMKKHTDLDEVSIHFLDSSGGLCARLNGDSEAWIKSGFKGFEDYLGQYLVEGKGSEQVRDIVGTIVTQADAMIKDAERFNVAADQDKDEIKRRIDESEQRLQTARNKSVQAVKNFRNTLEGRLLEVEKMIREFLTQKLPTLIDLEDFQPETTLPDGLSKLNPLAGRRKAKALQDECQKEILRRMNLEYRKWIANTLNDYLQRAVKESTEHIRYDLKRIAEDLTNITDLASGYKQTGPSDVKNVAIGVAYAFLTGDFVTGSLSAVYGPRTLARTAVFQLGTGFGLGLLMAAGAPITLPIFAGAVITATITAILTGDNKGKAERIKVQALEDFRESFSDSEAKENIDKMIEGVMSNVKEYINNACISMETALSEDIQNTQNTIQQIIDNNNLSLTEKQNQISQRNAAIEKLKETKIAACKIADEYGINEDEIVKKDVL